MTLSMAATGPSPTDVYLSIPSRGRVKVPFATQGMEKYLDARDCKYGTATIVAHRDGKPFLHVPVTLEVEKVDSPSTVVGIDRGIRKLAVAYDGKKTTMYSGNAAMNLYQLGLEYLKGTEHPRIQSPSGRPGDGGCCQPPCDVTPRPKGRKTVGAQPSVRTTGQSQAHKSSVVGS